MDINKLLDKCKELSSSPTDMALAGKLGITRAAISEWRHGKKLPGVEICAKIADMTGRAKTKKPSTEGFILPARNEKAGIQEGQMPY